MTMKVFVACIHIYERACTYVAIYVCCVLVCVCVFCMAVYACVCLCIYKLYFYFNVKVIVTFAHFTGNGTVSSFYMQRYTVR